MKIKKKVKKLHFFLLLFLLIPLLSLFLLAKPLTIFIHSPKPTIYSNGNIPINVSVSTTAKWIAISVDDEEKIIECFNCNKFARYDLYFERGQHKLTVYACTKGNRIISKTVSFSVA